MSERWHPNMISCWDEEDEDWRVTRTSYNQEGHDEMSHDDDCLCSACEEVSVERLWASQQENPHMHTFKKALAGAALIASLVLPGHASAREDATQDFLTPPANCELYLAFEDHSSLAYCESMGEWIAFDPDITGTGTGWRMTPYTYTTAR